MSHEIHELTAAVSTLVQGLGRSLLPSPELLDPREAPATASDRHFCVTMPPAQNTGKYRDHAGHVARASSTLLIRVAYLFGQKVAEQELTRTLSSRDAEAIVRGMMTTIAYPLCETRIAWAGPILQQLNAQREWLFTDVNFNVEWDTSIGVGP